MQGGGGGKTIEIRRRESSKNVEKQKQGRRENENFFSW